VKAREDQQLGEINPKTKNAKSRSLICAGTGPQAIHLF
jgi:hypothetical protein